MNQKPTALWSGVDTPKARGANPNRKTKPLDWGCAPGLQPATEKWIAPETVTRSGRVEENASRTTQQNSDQGPEKHSNLDKNMTSCSGPKKLLTRKLFNPRNSVKIGTWNVRTMYSIGTAQMLTAEMRRYQLDVLGVSESRWDGSGNIKLSTGETILYSGNGKMTQISPRRL